MPYDPVLAYSGEELAAAARGESDILPHDEARWLLIRAPLPDEYRVPYWRGWVLITAASSIASILVIALILSRSRLRAQSFNHYIVGLVIPDLIFSFACLITCAKHVSHGDMWDGDTHFMCDLQSAYTVFGALGSMWVNVLITREVSRLATCTRDMVTYKPTRIGEIWRRLTVLYVVTGSISIFITFMYKAVPSFPSRSYAVRGLNCLPVEYDLPSRAFFYAFTINACVFTPLALVCWFALRIWADTLADEVPGGGDKPRSDFSRLMSRMMSRFRSSHSAVSRDDEPGVTANSEQWPAAVPLTVSVQAVSALTTYFMRLLLVLGVMWMPFFVIWMVQVPYFMFGGHLNWFAGSWAHLQGLVSALVYLRKKDIRDELQLIISGGSDWTNWQAKALPSSLGHLPGRHAHGRTAADWDELERRWPEAAVEMVPAQDRQVPSSGSGDMRFGGPVSASSTADGGGADDLSLTEQMLAIAESTLAAILARERLPMLVVPWAKWVAAGHIPAFQEGLAEPVRPDKQIIFISHRWWQPSHPDDGGHTKYEFIVQGVQRIAHAHSLRLEDVAIWIDFACINQAEPELQKAGIASLITYAVRSHFVLVPVEPSAIAHASLKAASHPMDINNYGERAWCRCEIFVFLCIAEMCAVDASVYGFGAICDVPSNLSETPPSSLSSESASVRQSAACLSGGNTASGSLSHVDMVGGLQAGDGRSGDGPWIIANSQSGSSAMSENDGVTDGGSSTDFLRASTRSAMGLASDEAEPAITCGVGAANGNATSAMHDAAVSRAGGATHARSSRRTSGTAVLPTGASLNGAPRRSAHSPRSSARRTSNFSPSGSHISSSRSWTGRLGRALGSSAVTIAPMLSGRDAVLKLLLAEGSKGSARARFKATELPSSGLLTLEEDREHIIGLERDIRASFLRFRALQEKARFASKGGCKSFALDHVMMRSEDVQVLSRDLLAEPNVRMLERLSLAGNQLSAQGVAVLMRSVVCTHETPSLTALELSRNVDLGLAGAQAIALGLSHKACRLRKLLLDRCELEPPAGFALARGLSSSHTLELLDVSGNRLSDASVVSLHESSLASRHMRVTLVIDGNPLSRAVFQMAEVGLLSAAGLHERSAAH